MCTVSSPHLLHVTPQEAGQKLLQCLQRRCNFAPSLLHRWIRTGQIRRNGARAKPFDRVNAEDILRLPPFTLTMQALTADTVPSDISPLNTLPPLVYADAELMVFNKPVGLPVHTGTGHECDSLATRLAAYYPQAPFMPTPAHRLDKDTSGLILVALSYTMLRYIQDALALRAARPLIKEYLVWVEGVWAYPEPVMLHHALQKRYTGHHERVHVVPQEDTSRTALAWVQCIGVAHRRSLMHIRLLTGRTHQIRVQMAAMGHALCGDSKYGGTIKQPLRLHALRLILPDGRIFVAPPPWTGRDALQSINVDGIPAALSPLCME